MLTALPAATARHPPVRGTLEPLLPNFDYEAAAFAVELHHQVIDTVRQTSAEMGERADESALPESRHKAGLEGTHHSLAVFGHGARNCPSCRIKSKESSVQLGA